MNQGIEHMTPRELQVMQAAARGENARQTAKGLGLSQETVKDHRAAALRRLGARNVVHAVCMLATAGVVKAEAA